MEEENNISREFQIVSSYENDAIIPKRQTKDSMAYDFHALEDTIIPPFYKKRKLWEFLLGLPNTVNKPTLVKTGIRCKMLKDDCLELVIRSSMAYKNQIFMANSIGYIDSDYYYADNEGHIHGMLINYSDKPFLLKKGERFMQGNFSSYSIADNDITTNIRKGGFGSTNK